MRGISTKDLVAASYTNNGLHEKTVLTIADHLSRSELKMYVKALKRAEKALTVIVDSASTPSEALKIKLAEAFSDKTIHYQTDPSLLLGVRITDNDIVYDANLKSTLGKLVTEIENEYD